MQFILEVIIKDIIKLFKEQITYYKRKDIQIKQDKKFKGMQASNL